MIKRDHPGLSLSHQCRLLSISRSSYYYQAKGESPENLALMRRIDALFMKYPFYGSRQMVRQLRRDGIEVGRHRVRRLMRLMGLEAIYQAPRTSDPHPAHRNSPFCSGAWRSAGPTRFGAPTSPISRCNMAFCTWSRSWTRRAAMCLPGGCRIPWMSGSALKL